jgi:hypothetical protein
MGPHLSLTHTSKKQTISELVSMGGAPLPLNGDFFPF